MMKKNEVFVGCCIDYTYDGLGVVRIEGFVFFVPGLLVGEEAKLAITAIKKNYGYARIVEILKESAHRRNPACGVARACGGCTLMHMDLSEQKHFKENKVKRLFLQNAHMDVEVNSILEGEKTVAYRNKVLVPVQVHDGLVRMGFYQQHSNRIVSFEKCLVQTDESNAIVQFLRKEMEVSGCGEQVRHVLIKHAHVTGRIMVCLVVHRYPFAGSASLVRSLVQSFPQISSVLAMVNDRKDNVILSGEEVVLYGDSFIEEELMGCRFRISARSFFQVNPYATKVLYRKVLELAALDGRQTVVDLYCGTGTIGILMARSVKQVYGIEIVEEAIEDAKVNAKINGVFNMQFMAQDAKSGAKVLVERRLRPDVIVVDPPRKGCSKETLDAIVMMDPKRFIYVSCDPATLARDCAYMRDNGYGVRVVQPVNLFPNTPHVETVVLLSHKKPDSYINNDVEFGEGEGKIPVDKIVQRAEKHKPKEKVTYKMIKEYVLEKYGFKVHTAYIAEVKRSLGLPMYDAPNAVEELKHPRKHPTPVQVDAINDALRYFAVV